MLKSREAGRLQSGHPGHPTAGPAIPAREALQRLDDGRLQQHQRDDGRHGLHGQRHADLGGLLQHQAEHWGEMTQRSQAKI